MNTLESDLMTHVKTQCERELSAFALVAPVLRFARPCINCNKSIQHEVMKNRMYLYFVEHTEIYQSLMKQQACCYEITQNQVLSSLCTSRGAIKIFHDSTTMFSDRQNSGNFSPFQHNIQKIVLSV